VSLLFGRVNRFQDPNAIPPNSQVGRYIAGSTTVTADTALRSSAVWAAIRLRANLISTLPVDSYKMSGSVRLTVPPPGCVFVNAGREIQWHEFLYATQVDLDRCGNAFGVITQRNGLNLPARIELVNFADVSVQPRHYGNPATDYSLIWRIGGIEYDYENIWHERQYVVSGLPLGLNAIMYAAYAIGSYLSAQEFAIRWFGSDQLPAAVLRNEEETVPPNVAEKARMRYEASMKPGGVFVTGRDWDLKPVNAAINTNAYIESMQYGVPDIARYLDVPADMIDGAVSGSSVTYANITQRLVQLLVVHLGPTITRRELALSDLHSKPRFIKLNRKALLAMDPLTQAQLLGIEVTNRATTPDEWRALMDKGPLTEAEMAQFDRLFGSKNLAPKNPGQDPTAQNGVPA
jgi:HK97 family phage portal protein